VGASSLALLLATSVFAEERPRDETRGGRQRDAAHSSSRGDDGQRGRVAREATPNPPAVEQSQSENRNESRSWQGNRENRGSDSRGSDNRDWNRSNDNRGNSSRGNDNRNWNRDNDNRSSDNRNWNRGNDNRGHDSRGNDNRGWNNNNSHREPYRNGILRSDGRISTRGRISRYVHERGGYRVWFGGGGYSYWVPDSYFRTRRIAIGLDLRLGGIFRNGSIYVDAFGWPGDAYYNDPYYGDVGYVSGYDGGYVRGVVDSVDYSRGTLWLRDDSSGRVVAIDMRRVDRRNSRLDLGDLRRGDRVSLNGAWVSGGVFLADRIDVVDAY
jgi:hypothetical protein